MSKIADNQDSQGTALELPKPKWKPGWKTYCVTTLVLLLAAGWLGLWLWEQSARQEFEAEVAQLRERGEPVWFVDLKPEPLPPEQDGTSDFLAAATMLDALMRQSSTVTPRLRDKLWKSKTSAVLILPSQYDLQRLEDALTESGDILTSLRRAMDRGSMQPPRDYDAAIPYSDSSEWIDSQRPLADLLMAEGVVAIANQETDRAVAAVTDLLRFVDLTENNPETLGQFVRISSIGKAVALLALTLENCDLDIDQRQFLDEWLEDLELNLRMRPTLANERAQVLTTIANFEEVLQREGYENITKDASNLWIYRRLRTLQYQDMTKSIHMMNQAMEAVDQTGPEGTRAVQEWQAESQELMGSTYVMTGFFVTSPGPLRNAAMRTRQQLRGLRLALRVDAYYRQHQQFPKSLDEVLDESLPQIPLGTYSRLPPVYRTLPLRVSQQQSSTQSAPLGFAIYCVGENGVDDNGGDRTLPNMVDEWSSKIEINYNRPPRTMDPNAEDANTENN